MGNNEVIKQVIQLQSQFHRKVLDTRAFERILGSHEFESAFVAASVDFRNQLNAIIDRVDLAALKKWINRLSTDELGAMSFRELRELCKEHNVYKWSRLDKDQMLEKLRGIQL